MTLVTVTVRRHPTATPEVHEIRINGMDPTFAIATERIATWAVEEVEPRLIDLLDIAAAIFATDRTIRRGGESRPDFGRGWGRLLDFRIEVRDRRFWSRADVTDCLVRTISFLTGDDVSFAFDSADVETPRTDYLPIADGDSEPVAGEHVVLFSGGLDSLAGALETLTQETGRVILVSHHSAPKIMSHQDRLADALRDDFPGRVSYVPVRAHFVGERANDTTQRSRSFLFAAFGHVIASIVGVNRLNFFENGVVSQNLHVSAPVVGTMATRTTHPLTLVLFEELLSLVHERPFLVRNRFEWLTKSDVVAKVRALGATDLIKDTVSCNYVWGRSVQHTHCGCCTQCLDRRFGTLANDLSDADPEAIYEIPVLIGDRSKPGEINLAQEWLRHSLGLAEMMESDFLESYAAELGRIQRGHPGVERREVLRRSFDLHRRHGATVHHVLAAALRDHADALVARGLPETSLLRVAVAERSGNLEIAAMHAAAETRGDEPVATDTADGRLLVHLSNSGGRKFVDVAGLGSVRGMEAAPVFALTPQHRKDSSDPSRATEDYSYVAAGLLSPEAGPTKTAVARNVKRCRDRLAEFHAAIHGQPPAEPILIQNRKGRGYRLDPLALITGPESDD